MSEHTPTPWVSHDTSVFRDGGCLALCGTDLWMPEVERANAAFIVLACNSHDDLVKALEDIERHPDTTEAVAQIVREALHPLRAKGSQP